MHTVITGSYFLAAVLFIIGLRQMSSPVTARRGIIWAGLGMLLATIATFFEPSIIDTTNYILIIIAIAIGGIYALISGKKVAMTNMPQMIALYNGMGGGAAAAIAAIELNTNITEEHVIILAITGAFIGSIAFSGSLIAWAKLDGRLNKTNILPSFLPSILANQQLINILILAATLTFAVLIFFSNNIFLISLFFMFALLLGIMMTIPIGGADMPVIISLFNALTGLAVGFEGYVLGNAAMMIAGTVVGAAGTLLTQLMAKAMNRSLLNVLIGGMGSHTETTDEQDQGTMNTIQSQDAGILLAYAQQVIIVPGYGMAVAQAQHKVWELVELLEERGVAVKFAIHPVAGRMPGHMNVLLAEAGVPYDKIFDMEEINAEFAKTTVTLVIGANDVVNPAAKENKSSPLYGMPILDVVNAENVIVIKRGQGTGFSGVQNSLFFKDNTQMLYGDGQKVAGELIQVIKQL